MRKFAHIVHPLIVPPSSDLFKAQPVTFETMRIAREFAADIVEVDFLSAQYAEDLAMVPSYFTTTPNLDRAVTDLRRFEHPRRLPLLRDVLDRLYAASDAEYLVYTGVDIALQPYFYATVNAIIDRGHDAFIINRRVLPASLQEIDQIPHMYATIGKPHPGRDCYIFKRAAYPHYLLGDACLGMPRVGAVLAANLIYFSLNFREFRDAHLTFHLGEGSFWRDTRYADYHAHNRAAWEEVLAALRARFPHVRSEMIDRMARSDREKAGK